MELPDELSCLIIGGGPAGLTAATYLAPYRRRIAVFDAGATAPHIPESHNCPSFPNGISGRRLLASLARFRRQASRSGSASLSTPQRARSDGWPLSHRM